MVENKVIGNAENNKIPRIGVGVLVIKDNKILLGDRIDAHGAGTWCPPGGHLEYGETPQECAVRELEEETGLIAGQVIEGPWTNDFFSREGKHYVTLYMIVDKYQGIPMVLEPEKCSCWKWFDLDNLPTPLFPTIANLLEGISLKDFLKKYCIR